MSKEEWVVFSYTWQRSMVNIVVTSIAYHRRKMHIGTFITLKKYVIFKGEDVTNQIVK